MNILSSQSKSSMAGESNQGKNKGNNGTTPPDPNKEAQRLCALSEKMILQARDHVAELRGVDDQPSSSANGNLDPNDRAKMLIEKTEVDNEKIQSQTPSPAPAPAATDVGKKVVISGAQFADENPVQNDVRVDDVIVAKHVDKKRDKKAGVTLSKYNLNYVFAEKDDRDLKFKSILSRAIDPKGLPASTDLRPEWGAVLDQGELGSCVSNSVAYCVRFCYKKQQLGDVNPSRLFIYYNGRQLAGYPEGEDTGMTIRDGYKSVSTYSVCDETVWAYDIDRFSEKPPQSCYDEAKKRSRIRYLALENDVLQIKKSLKDGYPISFGAALFSSFMSSTVAQTGEVPKPDIDKDDRVGGHAMSIVGYDDEKQACLVVNNWGEKWGINGFCWFPYDYMFNKDLCSDFWSLRYWG